MFRVVTNIYYYHYSLSLLLNWFQKEDHCLHNKRTYVWMGLLLSCANFDRGHSASRVWWGRRTLQKRAVQDTMRGEHTQQVSLR